MSDSLQPHGLYPAVSSAHGILQARILKWVVISFSRGSFWPRNWTCVSCTADGFFTTESPGKPLEDKSLEMYWLKLIFRKFFQSSYVKSYGICLSLTPIKMDFFFLSGICLILEQRQLQMYYWFCSFLIRTM